MQHSRALLRSALISESECKTVKKVYSFICNRTWHYQHCVRSILNEINIINIQEYFRYLQRYTHNKKNLIFTVIQKIIEFKLTISMCFLFLNSNIQKISDVDLLVYFIYSLIILEVESCWKGFLFILPYTILSFSLASDIIEKDSNFLTDTSSYQDPTLFFIL